MELIGAYELIELVHETIGLLVYRARKKDHTNTFIVKIPKTDHFIPSEIARLKREYEIIRHADIDGIVKIFDIVPHHRSFALIMEDFEGVPLNELLRTKTIPLIEFLNIAIRLAEALGGLNQNTIIHK